MGCNRHVNHSTTRGRLVFVLYLLGSAIGCSGDSQEELPAPASAEAPADPTDGLQLIVAIDRVSYPPDGSMRVILQLMNRLDEARTLEFTSSQRFDLVFLDPGGVEVYRWSAERSFLQALGSETLLPGDEGEVWEEELRAPTTPGEYRLVAVVQSVEGEIDASLPFEVVAEDQAP